MFIETKKVITTYTRSSKFDKAHTYTRTKTILLLECDECHIHFEREQGKMNSKRASGDYYHVCPNCSPKRFAQKRGVERRKLWNLSADSDINISKI